MLRTFRYLERIDGGGGTEESRGGMYGAHKRFECMCSNKKQRIATQPNPIPL